MAGKRLTVLVLLALAISILGLASQTHPGSATRWWDQGAELSMKCLAAGGDVTDPSCSGSNPYALGESADIDTKYVLPHPSTQFAAGLQVSFTDGDFTLTPEGSLDPGAILGSVRSDTYLGTLNNPCYGLLPVAFKMQNGTTDTANTFVVAADMSNTLDLHPAAGDACHDTEDPELQNHVDCYPDFNNRMFDPDGAGPKPPLTPLVRMTGYSSVAGAHILLQFIVFAKGAFTSQCENNTDDDGDTNVNDGCPVVGSLAENPSCVNATDDDAVDDGGTAGDWINDGCPIKTTYAEDNVANPCNLPGATANCGKAAACAIKDAVDDDADTRINDGCVTKGPNPENPACANDVDDDAANDGAFPTVNDGCPAKDVSEMGPYAPPHPYSQFDASWGYPSVTLLLDPSAPAKPSSINFFCSPMMSTMSLYGKTQDNLTTTDDEGGDVARTNPAAAGTHYYNYLGETYRNGDEDAWESNYETCQLCPNQEDQFRVDADGDMIDACCDTVANGTLGPAVDDGNDFDSDLYSNGNDTCPLVSNVYPQIESERTQPWPKDGGINFDDIGDACEGRVQDVMLPGAPSPETGAACNNNVDDDHDGWFDEGCVVSATFANGTYQAAFNLVPACFGNPSVDADGDGFCDATETALGSNPASAPGNDHDGDKILNPPPYTSYPYTACSNGTTSCVDNCPIDYNRLQLDADGDKIGDACDLWPTTASAADYDGDGYANNGDPCPQHKNVDPLANQDADLDGIGNFCDPMPNVNYSPFGRPENSALTFLTPLNDAGARPNGVAKDAIAVYTAIDQKVGMDGLQQVCDDGIDNDGDTAIDAADAGCATPGDADGDGATNAVEWWVGTDTLDRCGNDCGGAIKHDAWAFDLNKDCWVNSSDILAYPSDITMPTQKGVQPAPAKPYKQRYDVAPDNWINSSDILLFPAKVAMPKQCVQ